MKKTLLTLLLGAALAVPTLQAADQPDAVYMLTTSDGSAVNNGIKPNPETDVKFVYNQENGCWEGQITNWTKYAGSSTGYDIKYFYSYDGDQYTIYEGPGTNMSANGVNFTSTTNVTMTINSQLVTLTDGSTGKLNYYGFCMSMMGSVSIANAWVSLNLDENKVTFTKVEGDIKIPEFVSIDPQDGSILDPSDGSVDVKITFSGKVNSIEALVDGETVTATANSDGTVWTITIDSATIEAAAAEDNGALNIKIQNAKFTVGDKEANVALAEGPNNMLQVSYGVKGISRLATIKLAGTEGSLSALSVYRNDVTDLDGDEVPQYIVGTELTINGEYEFPYDKLARFLFTVPETFGLTVSPSSNLAESETTYQLGTGYSEKKIADETNPEDVIYTYEKYQEGTTLTIYSGANETTFTVTVTSPTVSINGAGLTGVLSQDEDNGNQYSYYELASESSSFSFNFKAGDQYLVPATDTDVTFTNNEFTGDFIVSDTASASWSFSNFDEDTILNMLVDFASMTVIFQQEEVSDEPTEPAWYVRGEFNEFYPYEGETWTLLPVEGENGVYSNEFTCPEGLFDFNIMNDEGTVLIPAEIDSVEISFTKGVYTGNFEVAYDEDEYDYYWGYPAWAGGIFTVTLDINEGTITIEADVDGSAISSIQKVSDEDTIYNINGVKVGKNQMVPGLYIINGKKVMVK
ncbi:MAG: hypothetical protein J1D77_02170 [Muribaculaceae bacterium]|nr:hypothetical protein [Muribaculaceae bacterium]